ncbi:MAG TPA: hypothetical protein VLX30_00295 [Burkholderiales bacterium]|nr:hypothetical protein [Burkholderiales bacterium]
MAAIIGLAMMLTAVLVLRAAKIGVAMQPPPWWASDNMSAFIVSPGIVTLFAGGLASASSWLIGGEWRAARLGTVIALAAVVAAFVALARLLRAWAPIASPVLAQAVQPAPGAADNDPRRPPGVPPMKKAA